MYAWVETRTMSDRGMSERLQKEEQCKVVMTRISVSSILSKLIICCKYNIDEPAQYTTNT